MQQADSTHQPHVVVVGGGFGGLNVVKALRDQPVQITLVDQRNFHLFRPLLYQVAMAGLSPGDIAFPLRAIFRNNKNVRTILAEAIDIDPLQRQVILAAGEPLLYDKLVIATGAVYDYFGHDEWRQPAPSLESVESAEEIRRRLLAAYEAAELEPDPAQRQAWMTFVIVGGGPTGVELAGAIGEMARTTLRDNFRAIDPAATKVILVEALDRILIEFSPALSRKAQRQLEQLGVTVRTGVKVVEITDRQVTVQIGEQTEQIACRTTMWGAGIKATPIGRVLHQRTGVAVDRKGRVKILPDLTIPEHPDIFVIGDVSRLEAAGKPLPGLAPVAIQQGKHVAKQILRQLQGQPTTPFHYSDRGTMATIGRAAAVAKIKNVELSGFTAWVAWLAIHIVYVIGFRSRLSVISQWVFNYFTYLRTARLIVGGSTDMTDGQAPPAPPIRETHPKLQEITAKDAAKDAASEDTDERTRQQ
ncbi:MAG: NAD(P)/FAD-dependent oxidoreductase [Chloroflexota bacterium]|nr:NAD(P)/FAD-dependent oxidoreductase [Chloroflexota bacterium]